MSNHGWDGGCWIVLDGDCQPISGYHHACEANAHAAALPLGFYVRRVDCRCNDPRISGCRECDMCGGCETHEGCLTDLGHLDWFMQFASPGETLCGQERTRDGIPYVCAKPAGHGGEFHMARTGDGWPNTHRPALDQPQEPTP